MLHTLNGKAKKPGMQQSTSQFQLDQISANILCLRDSPGASPSLSSDTIFKLESYILSRQPIHQTALFLSTRSVCG